MNLTKHEQLDLVRRIENEVVGIADYVYLDGDSNMNRAFDGLEEMLSKLKQSFYDENTCIVLIERETGEKTHRYFEKGDVGALCYTAAKFYAFDDLDDTYYIDSIWCDGKKLEYVGWQPGMLFEFVNEDGDVVYSASFECWDH